jgi:uncharacterized protein
MLVSGLLTLLFLTPAFAAQTPLSNKVIQSIEYETDPGGKPEKNPSVVRDPATLTLLMDEAGLLTDNEASTLREKLVMLSDKHQADIVIVTVNSLGGASVTDFADDYFDYNGYGRGQNKDGVLLLVSIEERDWCISTSGSAIYAFTDAGIQYIGDQMVSSGLSSGDYASAFNVFADSADNFFQKAVDDVPFDTGTMPKTGMDLMIWAVAGLTIGLVIALVVTGRMQKQLKSVQMKSQALDYILPGSLLLSVANEEFLGKNVTQTLRPVAPPPSFDGGGGGGGGGSSTHVSSSGSSHGGGGGKF